MYSLLQLQYLKTYFLTAQNAKDLSPLKSKDCKDVFDSGFNITGLCGINVGGEIKQVFVTWTQVEGNGW